MNSEHVVSVCVRVHVRACPPMHARLCVFPLTYSLSYKQNSISYTINTPHVCIYFLGSGYAGFLKRLYCIVLRHKQAHTSYTHRLYAGLGVGPGMCPLITSLTPRNTAVIRLC